MAANLPLARCPTMTDDTVCLKGEKLHGTKASNSVRTRQPR